MILKQTKLISLVLTLTLPLPLLAAEKNKTSELNNLNKNIATLQTDLKQSTIKKSALQTALEQTETTEANINQQLKTTQQTLSLQKKKLQALEQQSIPLREAKNKNRILLKQQIRAAYLLSQQPYLKLLLAPDDVTQTHRILMYFHYITNAQIHTMKQLQESLTACEENQQAISHQNAKLLTLKYAQLQNQQTLQKTQTERQQLIQTINQHIETKHQKLVSLLHDKLRLEKTIERLSEENSKENGKDVFSNAPFARLRGTLPWPLHGQVRHQFGTQVYQSELKWDGTLINALSGQPVRAVAAGRVIFAKWMAGYGLLLIINHGNGYMTLYGRNQTLTQKVGDRVIAGEVIGTAGKSGGFLRPALYFSIRHNAQALNPTHWCHTY